MMNFGIWSDCNRQTEHPEKGFSDREILYWKDVFVISLRLLRISTRFNSHICGAL
ncbi:unnamed protein product [Acanthoscelides obtectus]|uniref:Uncharacterized protein n=1 Tax=Acanthoscelides obtectus TaxID=200917 RepID=A0A9P0LGH0_ACAOB|nr:unnamed protein product [Acanthoscelides obtectus]CAK1655752.1 hypothetical protein AOBTE_LOCUS19302 [Acanthoscelides obtectus]